MSAPQSRGLAGPASAKRSPRSDWSARGPEHTEGTRHVGEEPYISLTFASTRAEALAWLCAGYMWIDSSDVDGEPKPE